MKHIQASIMVALLISVGSATLCFSQTAAQKKVLQTAARTAFKTGTFSVLAIKMNGDTVACYNSMQKMVPASNMKLITTGVALLELGEDFRYETKLGYSGKVEDGALKGDLYIIGSGDPTTGSDSPCAKPTESLFSEWKGILTDAGINRIEGRVIGDPRYFDMQTSKSDGWSFEDIGSYYGAGPEGLNFFENAQHFYITPAAAVGGKNYVRPRYPDTPWMTFVNSSTTSAANSPNTLFYVSTGFGPIGEIQGSFPINGKGCTLECDNEFGAFTCAYHFYRYLSSHGFPVRGGYGDISPNGHIRTDLNFREFGIPAARQKDLRTIGSSLSPRLVEIVTDANKQSDNFFAETLMHTVGKVKSGSPEYENCRKAFESVLLSIGVKVSDGCRIYDGSGLSRKNFVSADFFVRYLRAMAKTKVYPEFLESLACPTDRKSTMSGAIGRYPESVRNRIHCKTGTMNGIRCYSGYILSSDGNPSGTIAFSIMSNNITAGTSSTAAALQELMAALALEN